MTTDRQLLEEFFIWLVDRGLAVEGYIPENLAAHFLMAKAAGSIQQAIDANTGFKMCYNCEERHEKALFREVTIAGEQHNFCNVCADAFDNGTLYYGALSTRSPRTKAQAEQNRARDNLEKVARANSGFPEARR